MEGVSHWEATKSNMKRNAIFEKGDIAGGSPWKEPLRRN